MVRRLWLIGFGIVILLLVVLVVYKVNEITSSSSNEGFGFTALGRCVYTLASNPSCYDSSKNWNPSGVASPVSQSCLNLLYSYSNLEGLSSVSECSSNPTDSLKYLGSASNQTGWCCGKDPKTYPK